MWLCLKSQRKMPQITLAGSLSFNLNLLVNLTFNLTSILLLLYFTLGKKVLFENRFHRKKYLHILFSNGTFYWELNEIHTKLIR